MNLKSVVYVVPIFLWMTVAIAEDAYKAIETAKWSGSPPHPAKIQAYLETKIIPDCKAVYIYYFPKGSIQHSPDTAAITAAFCIDQTKVGTGINQFGACEALKVDWNKGIYSSFYGEGNRMFKKGTCDKENLEKLAAEIKRQAESMRRIDAKFAVISDNLGFRKIIEPLLAK